MSRTTDTLRKVIAASIVLRASTNFAKPFMTHAAFVVLGQLRYGPWATIGAPLFGLAMVGYAAALWQGRAVARPIGIAYAIWATLNVVLFPILEGVPDRFAPWMYILFAAPGIVIPWLAVWLAGAARR